MADTGPIPLPGPRDPDWAFLRQKIAATLAAFEATLAGPDGGCHICAVFEFHADLRDLAGEITHKAYGEELAEQRAARAERRADSEYSRGFADGAAECARRRCRRPLPEPRRRLRPPWLRAAD
jgi:hypothetical protein